MSDFMKKMFMKKMMKKFFKSADKTTTDTEGEKEEGDGNYLTLLKKN